MSPRLGVGCELARASVSCFFFFTRAGVSDVESRDNFVIPFTALPAMLPLLGFRVSLPAMLALLVLQVIQQ